MLNVLRDNLRHLRWVLWIVAGSMVLYLGAFFSCEDPGTAGPAGEWAARIDNVPIGAAQFRAAARGLDEQYRNTFGEQYEGLRPNLRIGSQVIQGMIVDELVRQDARRIGLTIAPEELADAIRNDPRLQQNGVFVGSELYQLSLKRSYPGGVTAFESDLADVLIAEKWSNLMTQSVQVSDAELEDLHRRRTEKTAVDYVMVSSTDQQADEQIDDAELRAWYDGHQDGYKRDPGRKIRYLSIERDRLAASIEITEDEVLASYEANKAAYTHGDQRRARHILLRIEPEATEAQRAETRKRAEGILARLQGGEPFEPVAQALSEDPLSAARGGDLDYFERERMVPEFSDACFNTEVGQFAPVTETQFGFHVIQVTDARAAGTTPLNEVRDEIEQRLNARRAQEAVETESGRIAALLGSGDDFQPVAAAEGLEIQSRFVTVNESLTDIGVRPDFLDQVFALEVGGVSAALDSRSGKVIVTVDETAPATIAPFEEVESEVRSDVRRQRLHDKALEVAQQAARDDWSLQSVAKRLGAEVEDSGDLAPGAAPGAAGGTNDELDAALFGDSTAVGDKGVVRVPNGALVYVISRRDPFDAVAFEAARPSLLQELTENRSVALRESILAKLRDQHEVEINAGLIEQIDRLR